MTIDPNNATDPIRVVSRIKNNRLAVLREEAMMSQKDLAWAVGLRQQDVNRVENLADYPSERIARRIADYFQCLPEDLFPEYLKRITKRISVRNIPENVVLLQLEGGGFENRLLVDGQQEENLIAEELKDYVREALSSSVLTENERFVIEHRYGLTETGKEYTLQEVGEMLDVSRVRTGQIEEKALMKFRCLCNLRRGQEILSASDGN